MRFQPKPGVLDAGTILAARRREILAEYRQYQLDPIKIGREPISMELALQLGLLIDNAAEPQAAHG